MNARTKKNQKLFLDIETVAQSPAYRLLPDDIKKLWDHKASHIRTSANGGNVDNDTLYERKAGIYAEFAKIICISTTHVYNHEGKEYVDKRSFASKDEESILTNFADFLNNDFKTLTSAKIIGHNIREFDIPFIARRMIVKGVNLPKALSISGKKPWQVEFLEDTMNLWKFGDFKNYTSLNLLAKILNVPSPKEALEGCKIHNAFWLYNDLDAIKEYCELDVLTTAMIYYKLKQKIPPKDLIE